MVFAYLVCGISTDAKATYHPRTVPQNTAPKSRPGVSQIAGTGAFAIGDRYLEGPGVDASGAC